MNLNKGVILGIAGAITVFIFILIIILYIDSDFDQQLIYQVDSGVPADKLIPQIDKETEELQMNALKSYESNVINNNLGGNASNYDYYTQVYQNENKTISEYENTQKEFANREISKEQFEQDIKTPKEFIQLMNLN
jgi:hypothetical protein